MIASLFAKPGLSYYKRIMRIIFPFIVLFLLALPFAANAQTESIAAVVNEDAISYSDLNERIYMVAVSSGLKLNPDTVKHLTPQVLSSLIEEQIKLQEAERLEMEITDENIATGFAQLAERNNMTPEQFQKALETSGISLATMERQIKAQIAWNSVIQHVLRPQISISETDVDAVLERIRRNIGLEEYLAAEIFLPVNSPQEEQEVRELAYHLTTQIREGKAPFFRVAQQFSKAAGAPQGGDLGWISQGQVSEQTSAALSQMEKNQISDPIRALEGYRILMLRDKRRITEDTLPSRAQITQDLELERLDRMQRSRFLDLKGRAFVEYRVQ